MKHSTLRRIALSVFVLSTLGCASQALRPGTGDISFRLRWQGESDLDLHVVDPDGVHTGVATLDYQPTPEEMAALSRQYKAEQRGEEIALGGVLDIDCNAAPDRMCSRPIENIFWQPGTAPRGTYKTWVVLFQQLPDPEPIPFELEIRRGERVVETVRGTLRQPREASQRFEFVF